MRRIPSASELHVSEFVVGHPPADADISVGDGASLPLMSRRGISERDVVELLQRDGDHAAFGLRAKYGSRLAIEADFQFTANRIDGDNRSAIAVFDSEFSIRCVKQNAIAAIEFFIPVADEHEMRCFRRLQPSELALAVGFRRFGTRLCEDQMIGRTFGSTTH